VNSPESIRPCHAIPEKWNGTLDIAALAVRAGGREYPARARHGQSQGGTATWRRDVTDPALLANKWLSGPPPKEQKQLLNDLAPVLVTE
jgi:hypothetical protein